MKGIKRKLATANMIEQRYACSKGKLTSALPAEDPAAIPYTAAEIARPIDMARRIAV
jgi:hypothetical protein